MTILEWFSQAEEQGHEWANDAIEITKKDIPYSGDMIVSSLSSALNNAFIHSEHPIRDWEYIYNAIW